MDRNADFHQAVRRNDVDRVRQLLAEGADPDEPDWAHNGRPAILEAAYQGHADMVRVLLEAGADPNAQNRLGETALHNAFRPRSFSGELVALLLDHGADANVKEKLNGYSPLHAAARLCASATDGAARRDLLESLGLLCRKADPAQTSARGETALHRLAAGAADWPEPARVLADAGCPTDARDERGETALVRALDRGHCALAGALVARGASPAPRDRHGQTALHRCAQRGLPGAAGALLLAAGADPDARDLNGDTPLHLAAAKGLEDTTALLLASGADASVQNARGATALVCAVEGGFARVVAQLLGGAYLEAESEKLLLRALDAAGEGFVRARHPEMRPLLQAALDLRRDLWDEGETAL